VISTLKEILMLNKSTSKKPEIYSINKKGEVSAEGLPSESERSLKGLVYFSVKRITLVFKEEEG
jgi:hypothetical protein